MHETLEDFPILDESLRAKTKKAGGPGADGWKGPQQPGALGSSSSLGQQPVEVGGPVSHMRRGPPKLPRIPERITENSRGETDQEYKCRIVRERYLIVTGKSHAEEAVVDFFKQAISVDGRGVSSSFIIRVMFSRHWGNNHLDTGTSMTTITKTQRVDVLVAPGPLPGFVI